MLWDVFIADPHSRGGHPTQIPGQISGQAEADSREEADPSTGPRRTG